MQSHDDPIPNKKKLKKKIKKCNNEDAKADPLEDDSTCGIDFLNLGKAANDLDENYK